MGWSYGEAQGRSVGYSVVATCDFPGCREVIDRGLAYACNEQHGANAQDECAGYFCFEHRYTHDCRAKLTGVHIRGSVARRLR